MEQFFSNLLMGTNYELKNRYMHIDYVNADDEDEFQSVSYEKPKCQFDTLECTLEEREILKIVVDNAFIKQNEIVLRTGKSLSTVKRIMDSLQKKQYIRRVGGKRYGKWEVFIK